jgi:predicted O-methyltransferase YrrM
MDIAQKVTKKIKDLLPQKIKRILNLYLNCNSQLRYHLLNSTANYSQVNLTPWAESSLENVRVQVKKLHENQKLGWNYYSGSLSREIVKTFESSVLNLIPHFQSVNFLEIGSNQGISMSVIARMLKSQGVLGKLVSIDPYFENGYVEGLRSPWKRKDKIKVDKSNKVRAFELYKSLDIDVELLETISVDALVQLIKDGRKFHLIYIDALHEGLNPMIDFVLSSVLLHPNGILMLDDYHWPDVAVVKSLCDNHYIKIHECWRTVAYKPTL